MRDDGEYTEWRRSVEDGLDGVTFYHPERITSEHGGVAIGGAVSEDLAGIRAADGLVAYIDEKPQVGTITELLHAVHTDTPTLVVFNDETTLGGALTSSEHDYEGQELRYPVEIEPLSMLSFADDHWFLINYLIGDSEPRSKQSGRVDGGLPGTVQQWPGLREATVMAIPGEGDILDAVRIWVESEFGVEAASTV